MPSTNNSTYLITGGNRGIGHGLVATYLRRPSTTVIAAVRDPHHPTSRALSALPTGADSQLIVIQIDSKSTTDPTTAMATLRSTHAITHLDTVIANAGIAADYSPVATVSLAAVSEHMTVNGIGPLLLFQAVLPLLQKAKNGPGKFVGVGSATGSIGGMERVPVPVAAYGPSKAVLHWLVRKIHLEHEALVSFVMNPGFVSTDMGDNGAKVLGIGPDALIRTEDSVAGVVAVIDGATREKTSGHFAGWDGEELPW